jgi:hypothetical protein
MECVLPSLEMFNARLKHPTTQYIFYEFFLRAAVGQEAWKKAVDGKGKLCRSATYSFGRVMLENNYFYWLYDHMTGENDNKLKTMYTLNTLEGA